MKAKITYRGWAGHFICANSCRFRLNTLVELGDIRIVVSSVGLYEPRHLENQKGEGIFSSVGLDRHFETMAFHAKREREFWDADVTRQVDFDSQWSWPSIDDEWKANKGHIAVVEEIARRLEAGEKFDVVSYQF